jgi:hypothetical protein
LGGPVLGYPGGAGGAVGVLGGPAMGGVQGFGGGLGALLGGPGRGPATIRPCDLS